jgi:hypothetical protein
LADGDHTQLPHALDEFRPVDAAVLQPVAVIGPRLPLERFLVAVQAHLDAAVADGMNRHLPAAAVGSPDQLVQLLLRVHRQSGVVWTRILQQWLGNVRRSADQRAIHEQLEPPMRSRHLRSPVQPIAPSLQERDAQHQIGP